MHFIFLPHGHALTWPLSGCPELGTGEGNPKLWRPQSWWGTSIITNETLEENWLMASRQFPAYLPDSRSHWSLSISRLLCAPLGGVVFLEDLGLCLHGWTSQTLGSPASSHPATDDQLLWAPFSFGSISNTFCLGTCWESSSMEKVFPFHFDTHSNSVWQAHSLLYRWENWVIPGG